LLPSGAEANRKIAEKKAVKLDGEGASNVLVQAHRVARPRRRSPRQAG